MYKVFRDTHKWTGIILAVVLINLSVTGFLLLLKKDFDWIQPPTRKGAAGEIAHFITVQQLFSVVFAQDHPDFRSLEDIDRIDFRPGKRVHKVRSVHGNSEMQIDAVTGEVLGIATRNSDLIENLHDGSFFGRPAWRWLMPATAIGVLFLTASGLYLWIQPLWRRRQRRRRVL